MFCSYSLSDIDQDGQVKIGDFGLSLDLTKESGLDIPHAAGTRLIQTRNIAHTITIQVLHGPRTAEGVELGR